MADLVAKGVAVDLGGRRVLRDIDLVVGPGELLALVGPNGAGKTTLLRACQGLISLASGEVLIAGHQPKDVSLLIGYVPQRHQFAWDYPISVEDVVMSGRVRHMGWLRGRREEDFRQVARALDLVGMRHQSARTVGELSGGQRQRVLIARALATNPQLLLLDEPFTGVDMPTQEMLTDLLSGLALDGTTVVLTTHDLASAMLTSDRLCLINGTVVADGTPKELRDPRIWMRAFGVSDSSPLLATVGALTRDDDERSLMC